MSSSPIAAGLAALPAAGVLLVLPGFGLQWLAQLRSRAAGHDAAVPRAAALVIAVCLSLCAIAVLGGTLLAFRVFTATRLAVLVGVLALLGVLPAARWLATTWRAAVPHAVGAAAAAAPLVFVSFEGGYKPALSYQWFYWHLGQQLGIAHGIPSSVQEWGATVRWQPDYLDFNLVSQAFLGIMHGVTPAAAVAAWKVPLGVFLAAACFLLLRLWFSRFAAAAATVGLMVTDVFVDKITNNTPEALGLAFGFLCVWLGAQAIRCGRPKWLLLAGAVLGLTVSVHAIAATIAAMLLVGVVLAEVAFRPGRLRGLATAAVAAVICGAVIVGLGLSLQGRPSPLGGAAKPREVAGTDPTFQFLQYSNGHFGTPVTHDALWPNVVEPWTGMSLVSGGGIALLVLMVVGLAGSLLRPAGRQARGVIAAVLFGVILGLGVVWFLLRYHTYIPQHTGRTRLSVYSAVGEAMLLAAGLDVCAATAGRVTRRLRGRGARAVRSVVATAAVVAALLVSAWPIARRVDARPALRPNGIAALAVLRAAAPPGSVVVSNVATRGTIEFFTGLEDPLEGRQPLIEDTDVLLNATDYLRRLNDFLTHPRPGELTDSLRAGWMVLALQPRDLGTGLAYGVPTARFAAQAGLQVVWQHGGTAILRAPGTPPTVQSVRSADSLWGRFLVAAAVLAALVLLALAAVSRLNVSRAPRDEPPARPGRRG